jgi:hypothetical protein
VVNLFGVAMIELTDTAPEIQVADARYFRLLGYPRGAEPSERATELAAWARDWYSNNGRPWIYARQNDTAVLAAVSAGPELEDHAQQLWAEEKPDEYFFLQTYGTAVVEQLISLTGARLCEWAETQALAVLPHRSPGYGEWDIAEQPRLLAALGNALPGPLEALPSGALRPTKSQLALFGLTRLSADQPAALVAACENCSFGPCQYRRAPYRPDNAAYTTNAKALRRWAAERLSLQRHPDGAIDARFRYDGTTCTNMGQPLAFDYRVTLGPPEQGLPIRAQSCSPADQGYTCMCRYITDGPTLVSTIAAEKPLLGQPLDNVLHWRRPSNPAGCYCDPSAREHKWGLVLETIHYALSKNS